MYITPVRKEVIDFSDPIYTYGEGLIVPATDTKDYVTLEDLKGKTIACRSARPMSTSCRARACSLR